MYQTLRFTVDKNWRQIIEYLGLNIGDVLREAGLPIDLFERKSTSISAYEYFNLWTALGNLVESEIPAPLLLREAINFETFSPPVMAALCSDNFENCASRIQEFKPLIGPLIMDLEQNDVQFSIIFRCLDSEMDLNPVVVAGEFIFFTELIRYATGEEIVPRKIESKKRLDHLAYDEYFGIKPEKGQCSKLTFYRRDTQKPFKRSNEVMWDFFEPELRKRLGELEKDSSFSARVRSVLMELLPIGKCTIDDVTKNLRMSRRTLQRRLRQEQTNYQKILNHSRELLARHYLTNTDLTSAEISFMIGYDDPSSFSRAFHLWTGMTPEMLRMSRAYENLR